MSRVVKLAGITSRGWRSGRCGTAGLSCRSVARLLRLRKMRQGLPHFVRFRVAAALALGSVGQPRPSRAQLAACSACPSFIAAAEVKAAPAFFVDFTDGGTVQEDFARRLCWSTPERARQANVLARTVDVAEASRLRERSQRAWACLICSLVTFYMVEVNSTFRRAYWAAVERGVFFPAVPLRGRFGWRARAHWMGLL